MATGVGAVAARAHAAARALLLALALSGAVAPASAQHTLVLSGGGARGLAHAGVLVALDSLGYETPTVVGTSMGAVVGALYAAGYSPAEIWAIVERQNWADLFARDPFPVGPDRQPRRPLVSVGLAHGGELEGFVAQASINRRLVQLLFDAGVRAGNDFDSLPRRFRATTAELKTGQQRVLAHGDLARAVRASMAVPGVFAPVRWDDAVLVDGGVADNLGTAVAHALSADPVIAVDVFRPLPEIEDSSALGVALRGIRLLLVNASGPARAEHFVVPAIPPELSEATFPPDATPLLLAGRAAGLAQLPASDDAPPTQPSVRAPGLPVERLDAVRVEGVDAALAEFVRAAFLPALGRYDPARVLSRVDALYATGLFHGIWPRVERNPQGQATLVVFAEPIATVVVTGAARWDADVGAAAWAALRTRPRVLTPLELRASLTLERLNHAAAVSATLLPGATVPWAFSLGAHLRERQVRSFDAERAIVAEPHVRRAGAWLALEWRSLRPQLAFALALRGEDVSAEAGPEGASVGPYLRLGAFPPTYALVGVENVVEAEFRMGENRYARLHAAGSTAQQWRRLRLALVGSITSVRGDPPLDVLPALGGADRLPWLRIGEARGAATALGGIDLAWPLLTATDLRLRLRSGAAGADIDALDRSTWRTGGELALVWRTALAPVVVGVANGSGGDWRLNASVGPAW